jgi:hypothetical protein
MVMAEIQAGGPIAHQYHHRGIQSIMNHHHMDICHQTEIEIHPANISEFQSNSCIYFLDIA